MVGYILVAHRWTRQYPWSSKVSTRQSNRVAVIAPDLCTESSSHASLTMKWKFYEGGPGHDRPWQWYARNVLRMTCQMISVRQDPYRSQEFWVPHHLGCSSSQLRTICWPDSTLALLEFQLPFPRPGTHRYKILLEQVTVRCTENRTGALDIICIHVQK